MSQNTNYTENNSPSTVLGGYTHEAPNKNNVVINAISNDTLNIIDYFTHMCKSHHGLTTGEFRTHASQNVIKSLMIHLGYQVNDEFQFIFNNNTKSIGSISLYCTISEFGGESFQGDIIDLIQYTFNIDFKHAWGYIQNCFGASIQLSTQPDGSNLLPDPSLYWRSLSLRDFRTA